MFLNRSAVCTAALAGVCLGGLADAEAASVLLEDNRSVRVFGFADVNDLLTDEVVESFGSFDESIAGDLNPTFDATVQESFIFDTDKVVFDTSASQTSTVDLSTPGGFRIDADLFSEATLIETTFSTDDGRQVYSIGGQTGVIDAITTFDIKVELTEFTEITVDAEITSVNGEGIRDFNIFGETAIFQGQVIRPVFTVAPGIYTISGSVNAFRDLTDLSQAGLRFSVTGRELTGPSLVPTPAALPAGLLVMSLALGRRRSS